MLSGPAHRRGPRPSESKKGTSMTRLSAEQSTRLQDFLMPSRIAVVATVGATGMPQLTPNWYIFADGRLAISTTKERFKYRNLSRDRRLSVCIYSEPTAQDYVVLTGRAVVTDDESIWPVTRAIVERYVARDQVAARMTELRAQNRVIISLTPARVVFRG